MSFSPIPHLCVPDVFRITPELLARKGITLLLLDLDNTLSPYAEHLPPERVLSWMKALKAAGVDLFIISNNKNADRVKNYAAACDIPYIAKAGKPHPRAVREVMAQLGKRPAETALMGDQIFTDGLAARRAGVLAIVVRPLGMGNLLFRIRYLIEQPFRLLAGRE